MRNDLNENIYELLNDMDQDLSQYVEEEVSKEEFKGWKKNFLKRKYTFKNKKMKYAVAACGVALLGLGLFHNQVSARVDILTYHIQELMGNTKDLSSYSVAVNQTITKNNVTVSLGDVIVDEDCMYIAYTVKDDNPVKDEAEHMGKSVDATVFVNGMPAFNGSRGGMTPRKNEEDVDSYMMEIELNQKNLEKEKQYKIVFTYSDEKGRGTKIGDISFVASGEELQKSIERAAINKKLTLVNGTVIDLKEYVSNPVQQKINVELVSEAESGMNYSIELRGTDNLGREVNFYLAVWNGNHGKFVLSYPDNRTLLDNSFDMSEVTSFEVTPYTQEYPDHDGEMDTEIVPIGEAFTIQVK